MKCIQSVLIVIGLHERLSREMTEIRPFQTLNRIHVASNTSTDAWHGARDFANSSDFSNYLTTKQDYMEMGGEYLKEHYASNRYIPTPATVALPVIPPTAIQTSSYMFTTNAEE